MEHKNALIVANKAQKRIIAANKAQKRIIERNINSESDNQKNNSLLNNG